MHKKKITSKKYKGIHIPTHAEQARDFFLAMNKKYPGKYMILISARAQDKQTSLKLIMEEINEHKKTLKINSIGFFISHGGS